MKPRSRFQVIVGIVVAILLGAGLILPHRLTQEDPFSLFFVLQLPYAVTLLMLLRPRADARWIKSCMTLASLLGIVYTILAGLSFVPIAIGLGFGNSSFQVFSLLGLIPANLFVAFAASAARKANSAPHATSASDVNSARNAILKTIGAVIVIVVGISFHSYLAERKLVNHFQSQLDQQQITEGINSILACLEGYRHANSAQSFPTSLAETIAVPGCSGLALDPIPVDGYNFRYQAVQAPGGGKLESFRFEARPAKRLFHKSSPYVADSSGIIYGDALGVVRPMSSGGAFVLSSMRRCIHEVVDKETSGDVKSLLSRVRDQCYRPDPGQPEGTWENLDGKLVFRNSRDDSAVEMQVATGITGSARCNSYGRSCIRSYFMDETGAIRGTPERRPATIDDPVVPVCESSYAPCDPALLQ